MMTDSPASALLAWYDVSRRDLPWRSHPGAPADPYHVWLSEVMLQQTTVAAIAPRFQRFLDRWPTVADLAAAADEDVMAEWAGLGYYARARNLLKCARVVAAEHGGQFPSTEAELATLPGIGGYTAAAVAAIAFGQNATPIDGNIERVTARLFRIETQLPAAKPEIKTRAVSIAPPDRPGDFAQAMMDLGATICLPRQPRCLACPIQTFCQAQKAGVAADLPKKAPKKVKPLRQGRAYWLERADDQVLLRRRKPKGLLGAMVEFPSYGWSDDEAPASIETLASEWFAVTPPVVHVFTHFRLELSVLCGRVTDAAAPEDCFWRPVDQLGDVGLPSVMQKAAKAAIMGD